MDSNNINDWQCCSIKNKDEIKYFVQCGFGLIMIVFSMIMIIREDVDKTVWISLLSSVFGLFLPAPTMKQ